MKGQLSFLALFLFHLTGALGPAAELTEHSILETRVTGFVPTTSTTVGRVVNALRAGGIRVHFEEFPKDPVKDAIRRADGCITGWRVPSFSLDVQETSGTRLRTLLETLCVKDPRYCYEIVGTGEKEAIMIVPIEDDTRAPLTSRVTIKADVPVTSQGVYSILLSRTGRQFARPYLSTSFIGWGTGDWADVKVTLHVRKGWTLRDLLRETANAMGDAWCWQVWGEENNRQVRFYRCASGAKRK